MSANLGGVWGFWLDGWGGFSAAAFWHTDASSAVRFCLDSALQAQGEARGAGGSQTRVAGAGEGQPHFHPAQLPDQLPQPGGRGGAAGGAAPNAAGPGGLQGRDHAHAQGERGDTAGSRKGREAVSLPRGSDLVAFPSGTPAGFLWLKPESGFCVQAQPVPKSLQHIPALN